MGGYSKVSDVLASTGEGHFAFYCQACGYPHSLLTGPGDGTRWGFNGNVEQPTFTPSILVRTGSAVDPKHVWEEGDPPRICHSFVTNGQIQYLGDCDHDLKGQTVPLAHWDDYMKRLDESQA